MPLISDKVEKALREVGLTEYEILAYISLLNLGEVSAETVSEASSIPYTKVYSVLESLEEKKWIEVKGGRPRSYYPRSPQDALRQTQLRMETEFEKNRDVIVQELQPIYEKKDVMEMPEIWIIRGKKNVFKRTIELFGEAKKEIMLALPDIPEFLFYPSPDIDLIKDSNIKKIRDQEIQIKLLTTSETLQRYKYESSYLALADIRVRDNPFPSGMVVDGRETLLFLDLDLPDELDMALWSDHEGLNMIAQVYFQQLWEESGKYIPSNRQ
jgi:sugar-specific transcriptional regulator TrmB